MSLILQLCSVTWVQTYKYGIKIHTEGKDDFLLAFAVNIRMANELQIWCALTARDFTALKIWIYKI